MPNTVWNGSVFIKYWYYVSILRQTFRIRGFHLFTSQNPVQNIFKLEVKISLWGNPLMCKLWFTTFPGIDHYRKIRVVYFHFYSRDYPKQNKFFTGSHPKFKLTITSCSLFISFCTPFVWVCIVLIFCVVWGMITITITMIKPNSLQEASEVPAFTSFKIFLWALNCKVQSPKHALTFMPMSHYTFLSFFS